jgi:hypothetical protein
VRQILTWRLSVGDAGRAITIPPEPHGGRPGGNRRRSCWSSPGYSLTPSDAYHRTPHPFHSNKWIEGDPPRVGPRGCARGTIYEQHSYISLRARSLALNSRYRLDPVFECTPDGAVTGIIRYNIYLDGRFVGSRRTHAQCHKLLDKLMPPAPVGQNALGRPPCAAPRAGRRSARRRLGTRVGCHKGPV